MLRLFSLLLIIGLAGCGASAPISRVEPQNSRTAIFAAGCFWCVEQAFEETPGVAFAVSGYTGGTVPDPTYEQVTRGDTGHYEAVRVVYDPAVVTYDQRLELFWTNVDPFDARGQFSDQGSAYRSAIFPATAEETAAAEASRRAVAERFGRPVQTAVIAASAFYDAETRHQDYSLNNPQTYAFYKWRCGRAQRLEELWGPASQ
jgi:peptide-methionine (S)-S-oxide reductase